MLVTMKTFDVSGKKKNLFVNTMCWKKEKMQVTMTTFEAEEENKSFLKTSLEKDKFPLTVMTLSSPEEKTFRKHC